MSGGVTNPGHLIGFYNNPKLRLSQVSHRSHEQPPCLTGVRVGHP